MDIYLNPILIFLFATIVLVAFISDKAEKRIGRFLLALSILLPLSKIANAIIEYYKNKKRFKSE